MVARSTSSGWIHHGAELVLVDVVAALVLLVPFTLTARASGPDETPLDATELSQMEQRAEAAQSRDQCFLYTEVLHGLTELAGREIAAGDERDASATLERINEVAGRVQQSSSADAKRLKNAEMLFEHTTRRLTDMAHVVTGSERTAMQATLQHLDRVHAQLLTMVFAR